MPTEDLQERIRPAGFFKQKTSYIQSLLTWLADFEGDFYRNDQLETSELRKELLSIKGIGFETADAILLYHFKRNVFICDQYALRLFRRLGIADFAKYEEMRKALDGLVDTVPNDICREWHAVIDEHGKVFGKEKEALDETWLLDKLKQG